LLKGIQEIFKELRDRAKRAFEYLEMIGEDDSTSKNGLQSG
jgi:hypothetical protein